MMLKDTKRKTSKKRSAKSSDGERSPRAEDYPVVITWDDEDKIFIADVPTLQGCMTHGRTREEAVRNAKEAAELWLEVAMKHGNFIPPPPKQASGKLVVRMPKNLHAHVTERAAREGVSINTWIVAAIARCDG
jgi:predicted RNase H-like HicB family nuclease